MKRLFAILLLLAFLLPFAVPFLALGQDAEANLPLCCRRNGAHHCAMNMAARSAMLQQAADAPAWRAPMCPCPCCAVPAAATHVDPLGTPPMATLAALHEFSHPAGVPQTESRLRIARERSRQKRGPPHATLL